jgi:hypothetical protein
MSPRNDVKLGVLLDDPSEAVQRIGGEKSDSADAVAKLEAMLDKIEAEKAQLSKRGTADEDTVAKINRMVDEVLGSEDGTHADLALIPTRHVREFAKFIGIEPGEPGAYDLLKKRATKRDIERFLQTPEPPKTMGAGAALAMKVERKIGRAHV